MNKVQFELVKDYRDELNLLPTRATKGSAGYDFKAAKDIIVSNILTDKPVLVPTGVKCKLERDQVLLLFNRSSNAAKRGLIIPNGVGVVDSDYYNNSNNEGQIFGLFSCVGQKSYLIHKGDRIMQGIVIDYHVANNDITTGMRMGGFGSTGKN